MLNRRHILLLLVLLAGVPTASKAQPTFRAEVSTKQAPVGSRVRLDLILEGGQASAFEQPSIEGLDVVAGPNTSKQYTIVNGRTSQSERYSYELRIAREGPLRIGQATVRAGGQTLRTLPIGLVGKPRTVVESPQELSADVPAVLRIASSKDTIYEGEAVQMTLELLSQRQVYTYRVRDPLRFGELQADKMERFNARSQLIELNGQPTNLNALERYSVTARRPGVYRPEPAALRLFLLDGKARRRSLFFDPRTEEYDVVSNAPALVVEPLPLGAPANFAGIVGRWRFEGQYDDASELTTAEAITFTLYVQGCGDVARLRTPELSWPTGWRAYPPEIKLDEVVESDTGLVYTRAYEYVVAPSAGGAFTLQPGLSYFDTEARAYVEWTARPKSVQVSDVGGGNASATRPTTIGAGAIEVPAGRSHPVTTGYWTSPWAKWTFAIGPLLGLGIMLVRRWRVGAGERSQQVKHDPLVAGRRRLRLARANLDEPAAFYREVREALERYADERLELAPSHQQPEQIRAAFAKTGHADKAERFLEARQLADRGLYGGGTDADGRLAALTELESLLAE